MGHISEWARRHRLARHRYKPSTAISPAAADHRLITSTLARRRRQGTALRRKLTSPRDLDEPRSITAPLPPAEARRVAFIRCPNIVPPPEAQPLPKMLEERVVIVVDDDVSTSDMAPDGALGMNLWSNISEFAKYMFRRQDSEFHDRTLS